MGVPQIVQFDVGQVILALQDRCWWRVALLYAVSLRLRESFLAKPWVCPSTRCATNEQWRDSIIS